MATIFRARDAQLDRDVAVKLLRPEFGRDPDFLAAADDGRRMELEDAVAIALSDAQTVP